MIRYAVFDPWAGSYIFVSTIELAQTTAETLAQTAGVTWEQYLQYTHGTPVSQIMVNEDGSETWSVLK